MPAHPRVASIRWNRRLVGGVIVMCLLLLSAAGHVAAQSGALAAGRSRRSLEPGDVVRLVFWREPAMNGDFAVDETGTVALPLIGRRAVTGRPADELRRALIADLEAQLANQSVQVSLLTRVRILGAVQRPGLYFVDPTMLVGDAVALAGGATPNGRTDALRIVRGQTVIRTKLGSADPVLRDIRSGDQIMVPERSWLSRNGSIVLGASVSALGFIIGQWAF